MQPSHAKPSPVRLPWQKVLLDKLVAAVVLVLTLPLDAVIAVLALLDSVTDPSNRGPLLYSETRISEGRPFRLYKFRILKARAIRQQIIEAGERPKSVENRPENLTRVGQVLKKTGLDELPQFYNVLKGDMSVVGPRPKPVPEYEDELSSGVLRRWLIRAGLTGPAQAMKGTVRSPDEELEADMTYIETVRRGPGYRVIWLDLRLMAKTVRLLLRMTGE